MAHDKSTLVADSSPSTYTFAFHQQVLSQELMQRIGKNSRYSMRSMAKSLAIDPGVLSRVLSGERGLSRVVAVRICNELGLSPLERDRFIDSAVKGRKQDKIDLRQGATSSQVEIESDRFQVIADWYHYAILELTFVKSFKSDPKWIARALGITVMQAKMGISRLIRVNLLEEHEGILQKSVRNITTANKDMTTPALKQHQKQIFENALISLGNDPLSERSMTGMTMAIDPKKLPLAKAYIEEFSQKMCQLLEAGEQTRVYQLGVCLYPVQRLQR